jgi:hypothetical protein
MVLLYEHPGLIAAVTDATRVPACVYEALSVLINMSLSDSLPMPMLRNPLVLDALLPAARSDVDEVSDDAISCLDNLSRESENHVLMRDDVRIMDALTARMDHEYEMWVLHPLLLLCYIGNPPFTSPTLDLSLVCSRPFHHQQSHCKALIREHPEQLSAKNASGLTPLNIARAAHLPTPIIHFIRDCVSASALDDSLTHLCGYTRSQFAFARSQRYALMHCLRYLADEPAPPVEEDEPGVLNPGKALKGYLDGGKDPWTIITRYAF